MIQGEFSEEWLKRYTARTGLGERGQGAGARASEEHGKRTKYGNRRTEANGRVFDSRHEAEAAEALEWRLKAGEIAAVIYQQPFALPGGVKYVADFVVLKKDGTYAVMDAKSEATARDKVYRLKKRQMAEIHGIEILEV